MTLPAHMWFILLLLLFQRDFMNDSSISIYRYLQTDASVNLANYLKKMAVKNKQFWNIHDYWLLYYSTIAQWITLPKMERKICKKGPLN